MSKTAKKDVPVVAIVNMKGGVGKTTISAHVFREFYKNTQKNILLIDLDPQFNLTQTVVDAKKYEKLKLEKKTILSVMESPHETSLFETHEHDGDVPPASNVTILLKYLQSSDEKKTTLAKLDLVPGDFNLCKFSLMDDKKVLELAARRFEDFITKAKEEYDLICIDCNPSSSFLNVCALKNASHLLIPVRPDRYSMLGLRLLDNFVNEFKGLVTKPKKIVVLNGIPTTKYDPIVENELRSDPIYGPITLATALHISKLLVASPDYTGFATDRRVAYSKSLRARMSSLTSELAAALGIK